MKKILAFAGSNSSDSINQKLVDFVCPKFSQIEVNSIQLTDYELPIYSVNIENEKGIPANAQILCKIIEDYDGLLISVNEHNGGPSAFFKNTIDWLSRANANFLANKKLFLMSTSPGKRGAKSSLAYANEVLPRFGAEIIESFSFPSFYDNFDPEDKLIKDEILMLGFLDVITNFEQNLLEN
ncbi:MAG: NADPH-dependent FMN reductase [Bacteroidota bacterium]